MGLSGLSGESGISGVMGASPGATYYVATTGSDSADGSLATPWATLQHAAGIVAPGDTVNVRGGTYTLASAIWLGVGGAAGAWITIQSYPGETAILDGSGLAEHTDMLGVGGNYIELIGLELRNSPGAGIVGWGASHVRVRRCRTYATQKAGIWLGTAAGSGLALANLTIEDCAVSRACLVNAARSMTSWPAAININRCVGATLARNVATSSYGEGVTAWLCDEVLVEGNVVRDCYSTLIYLDNVTDASVAGNSAHSADPAYFSIHGSPASGILAANEAYADTNPSARITMYRNRVDGCRVGAGWAEFGGTSGVQDLTLTENIILDTGQPGLHIDGSSAHQRITIANNLVRAPALIGSWNGTAGYEQISWTGNTFATSYDVRALPGFVAFLDGLSLASIGAGNPIDSWAPLWGSADYTPTATSTARPVVNATLNGATFDGINDQMAFPSATFDVLRNLGAATIYIVMSTAPNIAGLQHGFFVETATSSARLAFRRNGTTVIESSGRRLDGDGSVPAQVTITNTQTLAVEAISVSWAGAVLNYYRNGVLARTVNPYQTAGNTSDTASGHVMLGSSSSANYLNGTIYGFVVCRGYAHDAIDVALASAWLKTRYGL